MDSKTLVSVERNNVHESAHRGWVVVCNSEGEITNGTHEKYPSVFVRSSLKPIQVLPFLLAGGMKKYNFSIKELAVMTSSHSGESIHTETVKYILDTIGLNEKHLKCGTHMPYCDDVAKKFTIENKTPTEIYCNCSGKHSGMLASCLLMGFPVENYFEYSHPLQKEIRKHLKEILGIDEECLKWGIDGCGVPTYYIPLEKLAVLFAKLVDHVSVPAVYQEHFELIKAAFLEYPYVIAGKDRIDTLIMQAAEKQIISKIGGEAILGLGLIGKKTGIAIKIEDGANRPMIPVIIKSLEKEGLDISQFPKLEKLKETPVLNNSQKHVGTVKPIFNFLKERKNIVN